MKIENFNKVRQIKMAYMFVPLIFTISLVAMVLLDMSWGFWLVFGVASIMVLMFCAMLLMQYNYFLCEIDNNKIVIKYYGLGPMNKEYKAIKLRTHTFNTFKIHSSLFGLVEKIELTAVVERGLIAKYPPISISALTDDKKKLLLDTLSAIGAANKSAREVR